MPSLTTSFTLGSKTPTEIFTMPEALEWFDYTEISKTPLKFDIEKLRFINSQHLALIDDKSLSTLFGFADVDIGKLAKLYLKEASTINELALKIRPIFAPKDFSTECGEHMRIIADVIADAPMIKTFDELKIYIMNKTGLKDENVLKPLRYLLTGTSNGPELSDIYPLIKSYLLEIAS